MTVSILVSSTSNMAIEDIPIATSRFFSESWLPLSSSLNLTIVPTLHLGNAHFDKSNIQILIDELKLMETNTPQETIDPMAARLRYIVRELEKYKDDPREISFDVG